MFEMIQIGAVKLSQDMQIVDTLSLPIRPVHYVKIHPRIKRMTKLDDETLEGAPTFSEAMEQFSAWCGEDYLLLTWGCDDVSVLKQNMDFHQCDMQLPPLCDIQRLFSDAFEMGKDRKGLKAAMDFLQIETQEDKNFHNALHDAYYTALVFSRLPEPDAVLRYAQQPRKLLHVERTRRLKSPAASFGSIREALNAEAVQKPKCPICGQRANLEASYVAQSPDKFVAIASCKDHGSLFVRLRFALMEDGQVSMVSMAALATKQNKAYVHTKLLQFEQKKSSMDPDLALQRVIRSSMPFEDEA
jgi:DNA polymerase III epsilon subunit-like protein